MTKLAYPTNRPFADHVTKKTSYKINRNTKFYKTLTEFSLSELPIAELIYKSYCYQTGKRIEFKGTVSELLRNDEAWAGARHLVSVNDRYNNGPIKIWDWTNGNMTTTFYSKGESSNDEFQIVWEAA